MIKKPVNNWVIEERLKHNDPRGYLDLIVATAALGNVQSIEYKSSKVYVISEEQYQQLDKKN